MALDRGEEETHIGLVRACLAGSELAWSQLLKSQYKRVYAICYRFTGDSGDAEDLTQDVFLRVFRNLASFDQAKGGLRTWIATLTHHLLVDNYRRTRVQRASQSLDQAASGDEESPSQAERLADTRPTQESYVAGLELKVRVQQALTNLSPELREAVILRDLQDMDYKEIAAVLQVPEGTVKSRISRGRAELAKVLQRTEGQVV